MQVEFSDNYSEVFYLFVLLQFSWPGVFIAQDREMAHDSSAFSVRESDLLLFSITNLTVPF